MAHPDLDLLLNDVLRTAKRRLERSAELVPFGCALGSDGQMLAVSSYPGEGGSAEASVGLLERALQGQALTGGIRAAAVCREVRIVPPGGTCETHALCARLEHRDGTVLRYFLPYQRAASAYAYGEPFATPAESLLFRHG